MCSETFLRLPEEKRSRFLDAAWAEFTRVSFVDASINQIVRGAGISRGSFYQYFKDKDELMNYLMDQGWSYLMGGYQANLKAVGGDIFALQLLCFDQFIRQRENADPVLERFLTFLRINPGLDVQRLRGERAKRVILESIGPDMDTRLFRSREAAFVSQVFALCLGSLAGAVVESVMEPGRTAQIRQELETRLDIIRCGSERR